MASSGEAGAGAGSAKTPADFLKSIRGRPVVVKLNSGVDYRGKLSDFTLWRPWYILSHFCSYRCSCAGVLACLDGYMNIAMEQTEVKWYSRNFSHNFSCCKVKRASAASEFAGIC